MTFPVYQGDPWVTSKDVSWSKRVKKISDTNYLVKTPGRRKETQVCHINMLKAYHEKPKPELVILNNNKNSQILNDLGTKLSHLPLVQRKE